MLLLLIEWYNQKDLLICSSRRSCMEGEQSDCATPTTIPGLWIRGWKGLKFNDAITWSVDLWEENEIWGRESDPFLRQKKDSAGWWCTVCNDRNVIPSFCPGIRLCLSSLMNRVTCLLFLLLSGTLFSNWAPDLIQQRGMDDSVSGICEDRVRESVPLLLVCCFPSGVPFAFPDFHFAFSKALCLKISQSVCELTMVWWTILLVVCVFAFFVFRRMCDGRRGDAGSGYSVMLSTRFGRMFAANIVREAGCSMLSGRW